MKLLLNELIPVEYYCNCRKENSSKFYFKYKSHDHEVIYCYGFQIKEISGYIEYTTVSIIDDVFSTIEWYNDSEYLYDVNIEDLYKFLPDNNPDKRNFIRRSKINSLLNEIKN